MPHHFTFHKEIENVKTKFMVLGSLVEDRSN